MDLEITTLSKISRSERQLGMVSLICEIQGTETHKLGEKKKHLEVNCEKVWTQNFGSG